jgi:hypothetical protein
VLASRTSVQRRHHATLLRRTDLQGMAGQMSKPGMKPSLLQHAVRRTQTTPVWGPWQSGVAGIRGRASANPQAVLSTGKLQGNAQPYDGPGANLRLFEKIEGRKMEQNCSKKMRPLACLGEAGLISSLHRHKTARTNCL